MTEADWIHVVLNAAARGDRDTLIRFGKIACEADEVKLKLRRLGFGVTGTPLRQTVDELLEAFVWESNFGKRTGAILKIENGREIEIKEVSGLDEET